MTIRRSILSALSLRPHRLSSRLFPFGRRESQKTEEERRPMQKISFDGMNLLVIRRAETEDVSFLKRQYDIHPIHLEDIFSTNQRPKIDLEDQYLFFVLHFPEFHHKTNRIESREIDVFLTRNDAVVVINDSYPELERILEKIEADENMRKKYFERGIGFLVYQILDELTDSIFPLLEQVERGLDKIDSEVFLNEGRDVVGKISFLRRNLIYFQTMLKPQLAVFRQIEEMKHELLTEELKTYFSNITDHLVKQWDRLEDAKELTDNISQTVESYVSFKTNESIRVLTVFSVILLPLTLLASIYGMNLQYLPFAEHPYALLIILLFMGCIVYIMLLYFRIKRWI